MVLRTSDASRIEVSYRRITPGLNDGELSEELSGLRFNSNCVPADPRPYFSVTLRSFLLPLFVAKLRNISALKCR